MQNQSCQAFGKDKRLLDAKAYKQVFDKVDVKIGHQHFLCLSRLNQLETPRLGLVIAKKQVKLAVQRNRIKRLTRESFRQHQHEIPPLDIIFLSRNGLSCLDNESLHKELLILWKRLRKQYNRLLSVG